MNKYALYADATAIAHATIIVGVLIGLLVAFRYKRFRPWEAGILLAVVLLWSYYGNCPLTIVEQHYRDLAHEHTNLTQVGFLPYYADKLLSYDISSRTVQRSTFFVGGVFFASSIEWFAPFIHVELFRLRRFLSRHKRRRARA